MIEGWSDSQVKTVVSTPRSVKTKKGDRRGMPVITRWGVLGGGGHWGHEVTVKVISSQRDIWITILVVKEKAFTEKHRKKQETS